MSKVLLGALLLIARQVHAFQKDAANPQEQTRIFSAVPSVGVHPRVLLSPEDLPDLKQRLLHTSSGQVMLKTASDQVASHKQLLETLAALRPETIDEVTLRQLFRADEGRNPVFLMAALLGIVQDSREMKKLAIGAVVGYANLILRSRELDIDTSQPKNALTTLYIDRDQPMA